MVDLNDYLKLNSNVIVDLVNKKYVPAAVEMTKEPTFEELAALLMRRFVHQYGTEEEVGKRDKAHNVLAMTIIYSIWCGWFSQEKVNRSNYPSDWVDGFKKLIVDAFEIGQRYSNDKP